MLKKSILASFIAIVASSHAVAAKDTLTLGVALEPPHLDPTSNAAAAIDEVLYANVFEGLTRINERGEVMPALAKAWEISEDGKTYTFTLQQGVTYHDGTTFDAEDVKFSLDRARAEDSTNAQKALFAAIDAVEVVDSHTVKVTLKNAAGSFLYNMGWGDAVIVAPESAETNQENPVGTGPFKLGNWAKGTSIRLDRNDAYWGNAVALKSATFRIIPDPAAATAALMAGDVDGFPNFPAPEVIPQFEADPRFTVTIGSTEGETILSTNNMKPPFDNVLVRRAIAHAINRQEIIDGAMFGQGTLIGTHFAPHNADYIDLTAAYSHDVEKAKALLAEAGLADGFKATLRLPPPSYARRGGEIIAAQLREVGIDLEIIPVEWAGWLDQVFKKKDYDLTIVSHTEPNDIGIYARDDYYFQYKNPSFNGLIAELDVTADPERRKQLLEHAQRILSDDAVNGFLFQLAKTGIWDAKVQGLWANAPVQANDLTGVSWAD